MNRFLILAIAALALISAPGCSPDGRRVAVSGTITLDGEPLESGSILFVPIEGTMSPSAGSDIVEGDYDVARARGPKAGIFRVEIRSQRKSGRKVQAPPPAAKGVLAEEWIEAVPARYNRESTLRIELQSGDNPLNFDLKSK
jgi:hypothetical protein